MEKELPKGWANVSIGEIYYFTGGGTPSKAIPSYWDGDIPWASIKDISRVEVLESTQDRITELGLKNSASNLTQIGEVIIGTRMLPGKPILTKISTAINQDLKIVRSHLPIPSSYTYYLFRNLEKEIESRSAGTTVKGIRLNNINSIQIILPPLAEQNRIIVKLDLAFGYLDTLKVNLACVPKLLKTFRQSVLTQAMSGKLTEDWRQRNNVSNKWKEELAKDCCTKVQSGGTPKSGFTSEGIPFLKVYNIVNQKINFEPRSQFISEQAHNHSMKKSVLIPGDVIMNIVGPPLNKIALVPNTYSEWNHNQAITLFRTKPYLLSSFLYYFFCEGTSVKSLYNETKGIVGQVNISLSQCRKFKIRVPSIEEQQEIVDRIEALFAKSDTIESQYIILKERIDKLPQALLSKAFRGELVPQDHDDQPASVLLENDKNHYRKK